MSTKSVSQRLCVHRYHLKSEQTLPSSLLRKPLAIFFDTVSASVSVADSRAMVPFLRHMLFVTARLTP